MVNYLVNITYPFFETYFGMYEVRRFIKKTKFQSVKM